MRAIFQSALDPQSPQSRELAHLFWIFTYLSIAVWLLVVVTMLIAVLRRSRGETGRFELDEESERRAMAIVAGLAVITGVIVLVLTGLSYAAQKTLFNAEFRQLKVRLIGHQWWWEARYEDRRVDQIFATANEIVVPASEPVTIELESQDVIHSLWIPSLMGKQDLIPGQTNRIHFIAERPGIYRGQCAEFCGREHALMAVYVIVRAKPDFEAWLNGQAHSAAVPESEPARKGERVFRSKPCIMCHSIRGTSAGGRNGPDLTHIGSRLTLAAGSLPLDSGTLAAWLSDPQKIKPGTQMPAVGLSASELTAVVAYLEALK